MFIEWFLHAHFSDGKNIGLAANKLSIFDI